MYLKEAFVQNLGPIHRIHLELPFDERTGPLPVVIVGENGSGKSHFLSLIADALFEGAASHFSDVLPDAARGGRNWFRVVGGSVRTAGAHYGAAVLKFEHEDQELTFLEKSGSIPDEYTETLPDTIARLAKFPDDELAKIFKIQGELGREIFSKGSYCYFPSSRSEMPHWLNTASVPKLEFDVEPRLRGLLKKPIFVEHGLQNFVQWLASLITDTRMDVVPVPREDKVITMGVGDLEQAMRSRSLLGCANAILRLILDDPSARFVWGGRNVSFKVGFVDDNSRNVMLSLNSLSAGQATLLSIFGTILKYADEYNEGLVSTAQIAGMCVVDEIDAHMHIDLQYRALPALMAMFPRVQFIVSSHSPVFVLGAEEKFEGRVEVLQLPSGEVISGEGYSEFGRALEVLKGTEAFAKEVVAEAAKKTSKLLVFLEGETDRPYFATAIEVLGFGDLLEFVEFEWIGAKNEGKVTNFNSGKDALNNAVNFFRANPSLINRPILLLYDVDANKPDLNEKFLHVRSLKKNDESDIMVGIENLLPRRIVTKKFFRKEKNKKADGTIVTIEKLDKMALCDEVCNRKRRSDFAKFLEIIQEIEEIVTLYLPEAPSETEAQG